MKAMTAAEAVAKFGDSPERRRNLAVLEAERAASRERVRKEALPILAELRAAGVDLSALPDLYEKTSSELAKACPVLMRHLRMQHSNQILRGITYVFECRPTEARKHLDELVDIYEHSAGKVNSELRVGLAVAIGRAAEKTEFELLKKLISDKGLGVSRVMLVSDVIRIGRAAGWAFLESLADDPELAKEIAARVKAKTRRTRAKQRG